MKTISLRKIAPGDEHSLAILCKIYNNSFPADEKRPTGQFPSLLTKPYFSQELIMKGGEPSGFFSCWILPDFIFIEHFAIRDVFRGQGFGSEAIKIFIDTHSSPVVLEVEPPQCGPMALRRIGFYKRLGFVHNAVDHLQPPYTPDQAPVNLDLMSYPLPVEDYPKIRHALYSTVYNFRKPRV